MTNTNATNFRQNLFEYLNQAILYNDVVNVNTKNGNAVDISEEEYNGLLESLYLLSDQHVRQIGRATCTVRVYVLVLISVGADSIKKNMVRGGGGEAFPRNQRIASAEGWSKTAMAHI